MPFYYRRRVSDKHLKSFVMTESEWKKYHEDHPLSERRNHHIVPNPTKEEKSAPGFDPHRTKAKIAYFRKMKLRHPHFVPLVTKESIQRTLQSGDYTCISAGRNSANHWDDDFIANDKSYIKKRTEALRKDLDDLGVAYTEITGVYDSEEPSFLICHNAETAAAIEGRPVTFLVNRKARKERTRDSFDARGLIQKLNALGMKYNQDSVMHVHKGNAQFHYTTGENKGRRICGKGTSLPSKDPKNYYSGAQVGPDDFTFWQCNLDWNRTYKNPYMPEKEPEQWGGKVSVTPPKNEKKGES